MFTDDLEAKLEQYVIHSSRILLSLSPKDERTLAYVFTLACKADCPKGWNAGKHAFEDRILSFLKKQQKLSLRTSKATSLAKTTSFNEYTVCILYDNLDEIL